MGDSENQSVLDNRPVGIEECECPGTCFSFEHGDRVCTLWDEKFSYVMTVIGKAAPSTESWYSPHTVWVRCPGTGDVMVLPFESWELRLVPVA